MNWDDKNKNDNVIISNKAKQMVIIFGLASFLAGFAVGAVALSEVILK